MDVEATETIGSGTFGKCFSAIYRSEYRVVVKEIKTKDSTKKELERAKHEVIHGPQYYGNSEITPKYLIYLGFVPIKRLFIWFFDNMLLKAVV